MRIFLAVLFGVLAIASAVFYQAGAFEPPPPPPRTSPETSSIVHFAEHAIAVGVPTRTASVDARLHLWTLSSLRVGLNPAEQEIASRLRRLQDARLTLPPIPDRDPVAAIAIRAKYADIDHRIKRMQGLYDQARSVLHADDPWSILSKEATAESKSLSRLYVGSHATSLISSEEFGAPVNLHWKPPLAPPPPPAKPRTFLTPIAEGTTTFFDYLVNRPHDALDAFLLTAFYYAILLLGIVIGAIYEAIGTHESRSKKVSPRAVLAFALTPSSWQGILASPLVFAIIRGTMPSNGLSLGMTLLAFQNGFFWRATMKRIEVAVAHRSLSKRPKGKTAKPAQAPPSS